eukprot:3803189-Rhodomonas_salina.1
MACVAGWDKRVLRPDVSAGRHSGCRRAGAGAARAFRNARGKAHLQQPLDTLLEMSLRNTHTRHGLLPSTSVVLPSGPAQLL